MSRTPLIAGNWKMYHDIGETKDFLDSFLSKVGETSAEIVICPPFTSLLLVAEKIKGSHIKLGSQNMHWEEEGAFTGEISPKMLKTVPCDYVIIGHSERRQYFTESDETVNKKAKSALKHGLIPIICVGESLSQKEAGTTMDWVLSQVENALAGVSLEDVKNLVFAYEPIWAIGTGKTASSVDAQEVISAMRQKISDIYGSEASDTVRILYGGSVKPGNIRELMGQADIDGALVGGASLNPESFYNICAFNLR